MPTVRNQNEMRARTRVTLPLYVTVLFSMGSRALGCCCQHSGCIFPARLTSIPRVRAPRGSPAGVGVKAAEQLHQPALVSAAKGAAYKSSRDSMPLQNSKSRDLQPGFHLPAAAPPLRRVLSRTMVSFSYTTPGHTLDQRKLYVLGVAWEAAKNLCTLIPSVLMICMRCLGYSCLPRGWPTLLCSSDIRSS